LDERFFGDFILDADASLNDISKIYGINLDAEIDKQQTLGEFVLYLFGGEPVVGDQIEWDGLTWTIAEMESDHVSRVGVKIVTDKA
jgi:cell volume regulation protein A